VPIVCDGKIDDLPYGPCRYTFHEAPEIDQRCPGDLIGTYF